MFREKVHRLTVYTLFEDTSLVDSLLTEVRDKLAEARRNLDDAENELAESRRFLNNARNENTQLRQVIEQARVEL